MTDNMTLGEYREEVKSTAQIAYDEYYSEGDEFYESLHQTVDGHQWMIYNSYSLGILEHADNDPHEWSIYIEQDEKDHWRVLGAMAYACFYHDVSDELRKMVDGESDE